MPLTSNNIPSPQVSGPDKREGYIYLLFPNSNGFDLLMEENMRRIISNKPAYPVIVKNEGSLNRLKLALQMCREDAAMMLKTMRNVKEYDNLIDTPEMKGKSELAKIIVEQSINHSNYVENKAIVDKVLAHAYSLPKTTRIIYDDALTTLSPEKSKLYILAHGSAGLHALTSSHDTEFSQERMTIKELATLFANNGLPKDYQDIRLMSCWSGDVTPFYGAEVPPAELVIGSAAHQLAREMSALGFSRIRVAGYRGMSSILFEREYRSQVVYHEEKADRSGDRSYAVARASTRRTWYTG